jgi:nucleotide-binding universal stress UspA family protein
MLKITRILVPTDFGEAADAALDYGITLAAHFDAELVLLHVTEELQATYLGAEGYVPDLSDLQGELETAAKDRANDWLRRATGVRTAHVVRSSNAPAQTIVDYATESGADLIVLGTHGRSGVPRLVMGSVAERVVRTAPCPVLTVHGHGHVLVPSDLQKAAQKA